MSASSPFVLRWGILATGKISTVFLKDLLLDPSTRQVADVRHKVIAVGSRDASKAKEWVEANAGKDSGIKVYGSYDELVADGDVDAVYIGTPHTYHYENTVLALNAGKHVLCEKPFTSNAAELRSLITLAKEKNRFLMEAMWTRFQPAAREVSNIVQQGTLGAVRFVHADLSGDFDIENLPKTHRILDPHLGGGALLDLGPYPFVWAIIALFEDPANKGAPPSGVSGSMIKTSLTGVDASTAFIVNFDKLQAQATLSCNITLDSPDPSVTIRFRKGSILVHGPPYKPTSLTIQTLSKEGGAIPQDVVSEVTIGPKQIGFEGGGWHFQADEVARSVRDGKIQSDIWSWAKSLVEMDVFDEVRKQGGYVLPEGVEKVKA